MKRGVNAAHLKAPDTSKLIRAVEDALTQVVYRDDSQVVELLALKHYAEVDDLPHVDIRVEATAGWKPLVVPAAPLPLFELAVP
jgi:Holliday junction resolvase RusA-like endonuclease